MIEKPKIFDERNDPDPFWPIDHFDEYLPRERGFITDFVYALRGTEIPTLFAVWAAMFCMSAVVKREAWIEWGPFSKFFTNLYVLLIGPAGCKKSTVVNFSHKILQEVTSYVKDPNSTFIKKLNIIKNKSTPEAILKQMHDGLEGTRDKYKLVDPRSGRPLVNPKTGEPMFYYKTAETSILASELAVLFGKQNYNESMIENLLDLYDAEDTFEWTTIGRGQVILKKLYTTLLGGTTPTGFKDSIPSAALGDGFLSRTILAYAPRTTREYTEPLDVPHGPDREHLAQSLAWIADHTVGSHKFSPEAQERFKIWYHDFKESMRNEVKYAGVMSRRDQNVRKVAFYMRAQRYADEDDKLISLEDLDSAIALVDATYRTAPILLGDIETRGISTKAESLLNYIKRKERVSRHQVMTSLKMKAGELDPLLDYLLLNHSIKVIGIDGMRHDRPTKKSQEHYIFASRPRKEPPKLNGKKKLIEKEVSV
jgi:hypothetical protein